MGSPAPAPRSQADVDLLRRLLARDMRAANLRPGNPRLLMLAGLPGSGKSTFAARVKEQHPFVGVESDRVRKELVSKPQYTPGEHSRVFRACHRLVEEFLTAGYPVLFDATNVTEKNRRPIYRIATNLCAPLAIVVVYAPPEIIRERMDARESGRGAASWSDAGWEIYSRMAPVWQAVKRPHIVVDTSLDTAFPLQQVLDWARGELHIGDSD